MAKPIAFNYMEYVKATKRIEELEEVNKALQEATIQQRIMIANLEARLATKDRELAEAMKGLTVTDLIDKARNGMCKICTRLEECGEALDNLEEFRCPLDIL